MTSPWPRPVVETVELADGGAVVRTTGATIRATGGGQVSLTDRLAGGHERLRLQFDGGDDWFMTTHPGAELSLSDGRHTLAVHADSSVLVVGGRPRVTWTHEAARHERDGASEVRLDVGVGGAGVWLRDDEFWAAVFPGRPASPVRATQEIAHEGRPRPFPAAGLPSDEVLRDHARVCSIVALHAYFWKAPPRAFRPELGRYALRRAAWITERHEPHDPAEFARVRETTRQLGLDLVAYVSPQYSRAPDLFAECARVVTEYELDGLYLDGLPDGISTAHRTLRAIRNEVGDDRILYLNATDQPLGSPRVSCPFIDCWADFVLRGDAGRGGLSLDDFLAYPVRGSGASNAVGVWCHYGSVGGIPLPIERPPPDDAVRAARRHDVRLWRRSHWGPEALRRFDAAYEVAVRPTTPDNLR